VTGTTVTTLNKQANAQTFINLNIVVNQNIAVGIKIFMIFMIYNNKIIITFYNI
jgi:hypothetical protein